MEAHTRAEGEENGPSLFGAIYAVALEDRITTRMQLKILGFIAYKNAES